MDGIGAGAIEGPVTAIPFDGGEVLIALDESFRPGLTWERGSEGMGRVTRFGKSLALGMVEDRVGDRPHGDVAAVRKVIATRHIITRRDGAVAHDQHRLREEDRLAPLTGLDGTAHLGHLAQGTPFIHRVALGLAGLGQDHDIDAGIPATRAAIHWLPQAHGFDGTPRLHPRGHAVAVHGGEDVVGDFLVDGGGHGE